MKHSIICYIAAIIASLNFFSACNCIKIGSPIWVLNAIAMIPCTIVAIDSWREK